MPKKIDVEPVLVPGAWERFGSGDVAGYHALVAVANGLFRARQLRDHLAHLEIGRVRPFVAHVLEGVVERRHAGQHPGRLDAHRAHRIVEHGRQGYLGVSLAPLVARLAADPQRLFAQ